MSSAVVSTSAAFSRPFVFDDDPEPEVGSHSKTSRVPLDRAAPLTALRAGLGGCPHMAFQSLQASSLADVLQSKINNQKSTIPLSPASRLEIRPAPEKVSSGIPALDALTGGLPRGCLTEICGPAPCGRTTVLLAAVAAATRRGEFCALIDGSDALDPQSTAAAGIDLERLLWVRCGDDSPQKNTSPQRHRGTEATFDRKNQNHENQIGSCNRSSEHRLEQVLRATDLLLESGGFGLIALDLADLPPEAARRIPLTTWFRFRRAVENKLTILLTLEQQPIAGSCSSLLLKLGALSIEYPAASSNLSHTQLLTELQIHAELIRSRHDRKPMRSVAFETKTAWAG